MERIWEAIVESGHSEKDYAYGYLTENIDFLFDYQKRQALELFRDKAKKFTPRANPAKLRPGVGNGTVPKGSGHVTHHESQPKRNQP